MKSMYLEGLHNRTWLWVATVGMLALALSILLYNVFVLGMAITTEQMIRMVFIVVVVVVLWFQINRVWKRAYGGPRK